MRNTQPPFAQRLSRVRRRNQNDRSTRECFKEQRKKKRNFCVPLLLCRPTPSTFPPILRCNLLVNIILINTFTRSRLSHARAPSTFSPALLHCPGVRSGLKTIPYCSISIFDSWGGTARCCGRAAGLTPWYLVTHYPIPLQSRVEKDKIDGRWKERK